MLLDIQKIVKLKHPLFYVVIMSLDDLDSNDKKVYEYLKLNDFVVKPWSTKKAATALKMKEDEIYNSLSNLAEYMKNNIHIHYRDGSIRIGAN